MARNDQVIIHGGMMKMIEYWVMRSWWVILFTLLCFGLYEQGVRSKEHDYAMLHRQLVELELEQERLVRVQEDLKLQINSQSDPDWIELVLMRGLGLVPEGQTKVFFDDRSGAGRSKWKN